MNTITLQDLSFYKELSSRQYSGNSMATNSTDEERAKLKSLKSKLRSIARHYKDKFDDLYGPFSSSVSSGNPIAIGTTKLNRLWSGISKGSDNKQYSAQISFVLNTEKMCLEVGFYFGRASAHMKSSEERNILQNQLNILGKILASEIENDSYLSTIYNSLFDYGYQASVFYNKVTPDEWIDSIKKNPTNSQIVYSIFPNDNGEIETSTIDLFVSMIIYLMNPIPSLADEASFYKKRKYKPLTAEQRAKQAERRTLIGDKGEEFVMKKERERLAELNLEKVGYPDRKSLLSTSFNYDILSCDERGEDVFIEVKTTTRLKADPAANSFFISAREYDFYRKNTLQYRLYRVYDIDGSPEVDVLEMEKVSVSPDVYFATFLTDKQSEINQSSS